ncbi:MAG: PAS domain S-box protein, partial [Chloroflexota bacterium]
AGEFRHTIGQIEDITDIHEAQEALAAGEARWRSTFEEAAIGMAVATAAGGFLAVNAALCAMLGYEHDDLIGKSARDLMDAEDFAAVTERRNRLFSGESREFLDELRFRRRDGGAIWARVNVRVIPGEGEEPLRLLSQFEDVTATHEAQEALAASEARLRSTFEDAAMGMSVATAAGGFLDVNPALCAMFGYRRDELIGKSSRDLMDPEDFAAVAADRERLYAGGADAYQAELRYRRKDGGALWVRVNSRMVRGSGGEPHRMLTQFEDVTAIHEAQEALAASEALFRSSFDGAAIGMGIADANGIMLDINPSLCAMLGYTREELVGRSFREFTAEEALDVELPLLQRMQDGKADSYRMEKRYLRKDGSTFWVRLNAGCVRGPDGRITRLIGQIEDISEFRAAQEALATSEARLRSMFEDAAVGIAVSG